MTSKLHYFSVLVIDANNATRFAASDSLKDAGFDTIEAKNAKQAFMYFNQLQPDIVVMDMDLPDMNGIELCAEIRKNPRNRLIPIMMMTDKNDVESIIRAYDAGATDFTDKPLNHLVLEQRTRYLLRSNQVFRALEHKERMLEQAERIAQLGSWEWDSRNNQLSVSKEYNRILGFAEDHRPTVKEVLYSVPEIERKKLLKHFNQRDPQGQQSVTTSPGSPPADIRSASPAIRRPAHPNRSTFRSGSSTGCWVAAHRPYRPTSRLP